jgi:uncharacterized phage-associated protein
MSVPARDVAAAFRARMPGIGRKRLHILMYFAQGHHLAYFGEPLFPEAIYAYAWGSVRAGSVAGRAARRPD